MKKTVLVIGGAGFIGSSLLEALTTDTSLNLISLDDYSNGTPLNHVSGVQYYRGNASKINDIINESAAEVYHFGEYSRVEQSYGDPLAVIKNNCQSLLPVLEYCSKHNSTLLYSASSTVFAETKTQTSLSPYTLSKEINTSLLNNLAIWMDIPYRIVYFYNVYGHREVNDGVNATLIAKYLKLVKNGAKKLPVNGDGKQIRNFTHIDDVVKALTLVMRDGNGDGYGIGSDQAFSILDVVKLFACEPEFHKNPLGNRSSAPVKNSKTKQLGWSATHSLRKYIEKNI